MNTSADTTALARMKLCLQLCPGAICLHRTGSASDYLPCDSLTVFLSALCGHSYSSVLHTYMLLMQASALLQLTQRPVKCAACCSNSGLWLLHKAVASPDLTRLWPGACIACTCGVACNCCIACTSILAKQGFSRRNRVMSM